MDAFEATDLSTEQLRSRLAAVTADQWTLPSNCPGWSVRDLASHVIGGAHRYALLLDGAEEPVLAGTLDTDHVGDDDADHVGDDPVGSLDHHQHTVVTMLRTPGTVHRTVAHRAGSTSGAELLGMRIIEQTLHAWDIARSVGGDTDIDVDLCAYILGNHQTTIERLRAHGFYRLPDNIIEGKSARQQLLALSGRDSGPSTTP